MAHTFPTLRVAAPGAIFMENAVFLYLLLYYYSQLNSFNILFICDKTIHDHKYKKITHYIGYLS